MITSIAPERITELQTILEKLDPDRRRSWRLELYDRRDGANKLAAVYDLQTGRIVTQAHPEGK